MLDRLLTLLAGLPWQAKTMVIGALPIAELRAAIPIALSMDKPVLSSFFFAVLGNIAPIAPLLIFFEPVSNKLRRFRLWHNFFEWLFERTRKRSDLIEKYETLGLMLFVAVPLPMTGAWTGCIAATLFKIRFRNAFLAISAGVIIAGIIVTAVTLLGRGIFYELFTSVG